IGVPLIILIGLEVAGCVSTRARTNDVKVTVSPSAPAYVSIAAARDTLQETVIDGEAALPMTSRAFGFTGGVDARIDLPNGRAFEIRNVKVIPRPRPRKFGGEAYFTIHTGRHLPPGTRVTLTYDNHPERRGHSR
ncbi:MAG: hypothetical protein ACTHLP_02160, partial [Rhizobiaceae bacterium]